MYPIRLSLLNTVENNSGSNLYLSVIVIRVMSYQWLKNYEKSRHKEPREPNESWALSRYGPQNLDWREAREIFLPSVNMKLKFAWNRKLWERYKINNRNGESNMETAYEIVKFQTALDLPRTQFEELEGVISDNEFEDQKTSESSESSEPHPEEWSDLDETLRREESEAEAEAEIDDWWISD